MDEPPAAPSQQRSASLLETVTTLAVLLGAAPVLVSCDPGLTDPAPPHDPDPYALQEIRMRVTEGYPEVDYTVVLDGSTRVLWGLHCVKGCDFQGGEVLRTLHLKQVQYLTALFVEAEVHGLKEADFGPGCRDEFYVEVIYRISTPNPISGRRTRSPRWMPRCRRAVTSSGSRYGTAAPGATTLGIVLENHTGDGRPLQKSLEYQF